MQFTFNNVAEYFTLAVEHCYHVVTCEEYARNKETLRQNFDKLLVNRVDIDVSVKKAERLAEIFNALKIKATFFVRLHANEYNPFSFENYRILKYIRDSGHEKSAGY